MNTQRLEAYKLLQQAYQGCAIFALEELETLTSIPGVPDNSWNKARKELEVHRICRSSRKPDPAGRSHYGVAWDILAAHGVLFV